MAQTNEANVRNSLHIQSTDVLSTAEIALGIADAVANINVTDEQAERYLACYLIAKTLSWSTIQSTDGTTYKKPDPDFFWELYNDRLRQLGKGKMKKVNWESADNEDYSD